MSNIRKFRKPTVAVLTALLIISIAMPLLSLASAGNAVATLGTTSGPNGTLVQVSGTGFKANDAVGALTITVDGATGKAITTSVVGPPAAVIDTAYQLKTDANGVLTGYFIIYNLNLGAHTVIISDAESNAVAGTFTITAPTVTVTPSALSAGSSVTVSANGFPSPNSTIVTTFNQMVTAASFSGNAITIDAPVPPATTYTSTSSPTSLSSSRITAGRVTATVSLPAVTAAGPVFTITDYWGNTATTTLSLTTPTVTLSPSSGPVGTWVTATVTGFGPTATITSPAIQVGNIAGTTSTATMSPASVTVTEQGTAVFLFQIPAGTTTTLSGVAGAQAVTVTDNKGNVGTATFTVTPKVTMTLGTAATDSTTTYVPATTANVVIRLDATGFKANTPVTFGFSPGIPAAWRTPSATWTDPNTQINANLQLVTDENGQITGIVTDAGTSPTAVGQYWISISDGTTTVTTTINVVTAGDILAVKTLSGAVGQTGVEFTYFGSGTTPTGATLGGAPLTVVPGVWVAASAWPAPHVASFTVPAGAAGVRTLALAGGAFNTAAFTVLSTSVTAISPSSANVGTTVTVVGNGYASNVVALQIEGATVPAGTVTATMPAGTNLVIITFPVPNYLPSTYTLSVSTASNTATTSLTVAAPSISITPTSGTLTGLFGTTTLAITGSGFKASDTITVTYDGTTITAAAPVGLTVINTNGGILINSGFSIVNPSTAGVHTVTVQGSTGAYASATFTVSPKLNTLAAVRPGSAVTVSGIGFAGSSVLTLSINGTQTSWYDTSVTPPTVIPAGTTVSSGPTGSLLVGANRGFVVPSTETSTALVVTITDAAGNSASTTLSILATPAIKVGSPNIVAGTTGLMAVSINGTGFTPRTTPPIAAALYSGSTLVTAVTLVRLDTGATVTTATVGSTGAIPSVPGNPLLGFTIPSGITPGTYTLQFTVGNVGNLPVETASATVTVMGAPTVTAPTTAASGTNVTITVTGLTAISTATFKGVNILAPATFGPATVLNSGANAYTLTTWFIVPTNEFKGTYLLTLTDANTGLSCQAAITVTPAINLAVATGSKGTTLTVTGSGFAATSAITATVNGAAVTLGPAAANRVTDATGSIIAATTFTIPVTALATNTLTITDAAGNTASATFNVTAAVVTVAPTTAAAGSTVQVIGSGFTASSPIVIQVNGQVVTTVPASLAANGAGDFITYITVPAGLSGDVTVTATDNSNNVGTATLTVGGSTGQGVPSQTTMTSTAQTTTTSGTATTTFTAGSTVKAGFMLQSTSGSRDVVVAVTFQQGAKVYNMASFQTTMTTTASAVSFSNLIPAGATGTWTATLQVFASDGVTPLAVTTLTFTVA